MQHPDLVGGMFLSRQTVWKPVLLHSLHWLHQNHTHQLNQLLSHQGIYSKKKTQRVQAVVIFKSSTKLTEKKLGITLGPPHLWPVLCSLKKSSSLLRGQWHQKVNTFFETSFYLSFEDSKKKASEFLKTTKTTKEWQGMLFHTWKKPHRYLVRSQQT